jgi:hypothetical protein
MVREGFSTRRREIAKINGVSLEEAEIIKKEIDNEHEEDMKTIDMGIIKPENEENEEVDNMEKTDNVSP